LVDRAAPQPVVVVEVRVASRTGRAAAVALRAIDLEQRLAGRRREFRKLRTGLDLRHRQRGDLVGELALRLLGIGKFGLQLETILGYLFGPLALVMGVPAKDAIVVGNLLGTRTVLNEVIAYSQLGPLKSSLDPRSFTIATYALCGFANFSSIGIQIGGIGALAPERRDDLARLGLRALLAGTFANFMTACIAGLLL